MVQLQVNGMTCQNCVKHVAEALSAVPNVARVEVDLASGLARVEGAPETAALVSALEEEGYEAKVV